MPLAWDVFHGWNGFLYRTCPPSPHVQEVRILQYYSTNCYPTNQAPSIPLSAPYYLYSTVRILQYSTNYYPTNQAQSIPLSAPYYLYSTLRILQYSTNCYPTNQAPSIPLSAPYYLYSTVRILQYSTNCYSTNQAPSIPLAAPYVLSVVCMYIVQLCQCLIMVYKTVAMELLIPLE